MCHCGSEAVLYSLHFNTVKLSTVNMTLFADRASMYYVKVLHNSYIDLFIIGHYFSSPVRLPGRHLEWPEARCVGESQATRPNTIIRLSSSLTITMPPTTDCDCTTFHSPGSAVVSKWDNVMGDG